MLGRKSGVSQKLTVQFPNTGMQFLLSRPGLGNITELLTPEFISVFEELSENQQAVWNLTNKHSFIVQYEPRT
jgi:hypothetical protein